MSDKPNPRKRKKPRLTLGELTPEEQIAIARQTPGARVISPDDPEVQADRRRVYGMLGRAPLIDPKIKAVIYWPEGTDPNVQP